MSENAHKKVCGAEITWPSSKPLIYPSHQNDVNSAESGLTYALPPNVSTSE